MKKLLLVMLLVLGGFFGLVNAEGEAQVAENPAAQAPAEPVEAEEGKKVEAPEASAQAQEEPAAVSDAQQQEDFQNMVKELNEMMNKEGQEGSAE